MSVKKTAAGTPSVPPRSKRPQAADPAKKADNARFEKLDANNDGTLGKKELLERGAARFAARDLNLDGKVSRAESRMDFKLLDQDQDGVLAGSEPKQLARYDTDGDAAVSSEEYLAGQRADRATARRAIRDHAFEALDLSQDEALTGRELKGIERYDADQDGSVSRTEFHRGVHADWRAERDERVERRFAAADGNEDGVLSRKEAKAFRRYDGDGDRRVSRLEFEVGQEVDRKARADSNILGEATRPAQEGAPASDVAEPSANRHAPTDLVISSFNVLGSSHTRPGGNKPGMDPGPERMRRAIELLERHKVDIVGFQELQKDQLKVFQEKAGDKFGVYPGFKLGKGDNVNSLAWRKDKWDLVKADSIAIPYFDGHKVDMPVVRLRNKETGQEAYFTNFHNPASTRFHPGNEGWRDKATELQIDLVNRLRKESGLPVFVTGDMNERAEYYDKITRGTGMVSADEGPGGRRPKNMGIDWIFGSPDVTFSDFVRDRGDLVRRTSDHPMIVSRARIGGKKD